MSLPIRKLLSRKFDNSDNWQVSWLAYCDRPSHPVRAVAKQVITVSLTRRPELSLQLREQLRIISQKGKAPDSLLIFPSKVLSQNQKSGRR